MSDREFENYLALLTGMLRLRRTQRESISGELRDHLIEHVAQLEASGSTHEEAVRRALEEFGDAAALAANFSALVGMRRRRLIMRCTIGTTVVMTGLVVAMLAFRPEVADDPSLVQAQAEPAPKDNPPGYGTLVQQPRRQAPQAIDAGPRDTDQRTRLILKEPIDEFDVTEAPLNTVLDILGDKHGVQFYIDKRSFRDADANVEAPVSLRLNKVPLEMVLDLILREHQLGYRIRNGVVVVASEADVQSKTEVRVYRVPDGMEMAEELAALIPATIEDQSWREHVVVVDPRGHRRAGYGATGVGYGGSSDGGGGYGQPAAAETVGGGPMGVGTIRVFRGTLVVSQTPEVHQKIEKLLADLERAGAMEPRRRTSREADGDRFGGNGPPAEVSPFGDTVQPGYGRTGDGGRGYGSVPRTSADRSGGYGSTAPAPSPTRDQPPTDGGSAGAPTADPRSLAPVEANPFAPTTTAPDEALPNPFDPVSAPSTTTAPAPESPPAGAGGGR